MIACSSQLIALCGGGLIALAGPPLLATSQLEEAPRPVVFSAPTTASPPISPKITTKKKEAPLHNEQRAEIESTPAVYPSVASRPIATLRNDASQSETSRFALPHTLQAAFSEGKVEQLQPVAETEAPVEEFEPDDAFRPTIGTAIRVAVASVGIDVAVRPGGYDAARDAWQVDHTSAFHADTTVPVNDSNGTTLLYGHAASGIFGSLPNIQTGAEAVVTTSEGLKFVYTFESTSQVVPSDTSMLTVEGEPKLVLQTCSGMFDQHRTLVVFRLKEVTNP